MPRRIHVPAVFVGDVPLSPNEAHHVRDVLRLNEGVAVEAFDDAGQIGVGTLVLGGGVSIRVRELLVATPAGLRIVVASAVPKAARADWLVEKLSEIGVDRFIPLATARSVVVPEGKNKVDRWARLATEAAKQSHRTGVMQIAQVAPLSTAVRDAKRAWWLSTEPDAEPILDRLSQPLETDELTLFIGPEGGWTDEEAELFRQAGVSGVGLTRTILRIETAAIAAAVIVAASAVRQSNRAP